MKRVVDRDTYEKVMLVANTFKAGEQFRHDVMLHNIKALRQVFSNQISSQSMKKRD